MECLLKVTDPVIDITKIKLRQLDVNTKNHVRTGLSVKSLIYDLE